MEHTNAISQRSTTPRHAGRGSRQVHPWDHSQEGRARNSSGADQEAAASAAQAGTPASRASSSCGESNAPLEPLEWKTTQALKWAHEDTKICAFKHRSPRFPALTNLNRKNIKKRPITLAGQAKDGKDDR